jgi:predicted 2-oxoglutarate/Fe(II)-dependent dioxygenase YbiX
MIHEMYGLISDKSFCDRVIDYFESKKNENITQTRIGFLGETLDSSEILDDKLRKEIKCLVYRITQEFYMHSKTFIYPEFWDITYWAPGTMMEPHVDTIRISSNNSTDITYSKIKKDEQINIQIRDYTAICYLNDGYDGGKTFIMGESGETKPVYKCTPEKEKVFIFPSNRTHGVTKVKDKSRYTLSIWFSKNSKFLME